MEEFEKNWFSRWIEGLGWVLIFLCPFLAFGALGLLAFFALGIWLGVFIGAFLLLIGIILGYLFAQWVNKRMGTMFFISRVSATPQLDHKEKKQDRP
jgi:hypothetical protein